jgi:nicotinate-nucleotide adenylyltransferase
VLGGTFDPVHWGHLMLAEAAREELTLDIVLFVPAGDPWRKSDARAITPAEHRLAMLRLAIAGNDAFGISDIELKREGPSYTADTLAALAAERLDDEFFFVVGADALADMPNWHDPERIARHATIAVAPRDARQEARVAELSVPGIEGRVVTFPLTRVDISSTLARERVIERRSIRYLVPEAVREYIEEQGLYR